MTGSNNAYHFKVHIQQIFQVIMVNSDRNNHASIPWGIWTDEEFQRSSPYRCKSKSTVSTIYCDVCDLTTHTPKVQNSVRTALPEHCLFLLCKYLFIVSYLGIFYWCSVEKSSLLILLCLNFGERILCRKCSVAIYTIFSLNKVRV